MNFDLVHNLTVAINPEENNGCLQFPGSSIQAETLVAVKKEIGKFPFCMNYISPVATTQHSLQQKRPNCGN